jgi:hypothetical protein
MRSTFLSVLFVMSYTDFTSSLYYQNAPERAAACPVTIHALLHVADCIEWLGPIWAYWMFPTERLCSEIPRAAKSRRFPFEAINLHLVNSAHLQSTIIRFQLDLAPPPAPNTHTRTLSPHLCKSLSCSYLNFLIHFT